MALKSSRDGLRKELVDYLGNLIINKKLQEDILKTINSFIKIDLLWTNASPTNAFHPQTISLDLSNYNNIETLKICLNVTKSDEIETNDRATCNFKDIYYSIY